MGPERKMKMGHFHSVPVKMGSLASCVDEIFSSFLKFERQGLGGNFGHWVPLLIPSRRSITTLSQQPGS